MTQDIASHACDSIFRRKEPEDKGYLPCYEYNKVMLLKGEKESTVPTFGELREERDFPEQAQYLFSINDRAYYCVMGTTMPEFGGFCMEPLTVFQNFEPLHQAFAGVTGSQLYRQVQGRRLCGCCGSKAEPSARERAPVCPFCGQTKYPKISPAVVVVITNGDELLMSRYAGGAYRNHVLITGFVEIRETFEDCVCREAIGEMGFGVKNIRYYGSQPWALSDTKMVGFTAELDGDDIICLEEEELCKTSWSTRGEIVECGPCISVGYEMMRTFKSGKIQQAAT